MPRFAYFDSPWPKLGSLRERAWTEWRLLASAASALTEESKMHVSRVSMGSKGDPSGLHRQVQCFSSVGID